MAIIFGLGFTGLRLARLLLERPGPDDGRVLAAVRDVTRFRELQKQGLQLSELALDRHPWLNPEMPRNQVLALLIPPLPSPENAALREIIAHLAPKRVVYVSSTGIYGDQNEVDDTNPAKPNDERGRRRLEEENWIASGPWTSLILRAAAIYGPNRGVHAAIRQGKLPRGAGFGIVSRIHVDDLAALIEAGIYSDIQGAWPVADDTPCSSLEIAKWCEKLPGFGLAGEHWDLPEARGSAIPAGRRVDGAKIRKILSVDLKYPTWRTGIEASIAQENPPQGGIVQGNAAQEK